MINYIAYEWKTLLLASIFGLFETWFYLSGRLSMGDIMDVATGAASGSILKFSLQAIIFTFLGFVFAYFSGKALYAFGDNITSRQRIDILDSLYKNPTPEFHEDSIDSYINLIDEDIDNIRISYYYNIPLMIMGLIQVILHAVALFNIHPTIFGLSIVFSILPIIVSRFFINPMKKVQVNRSKTNEEYMGGLKELLTGYDTIKGTNRFDKFIGIFGKSLNERAEGIAKLNIMQTMAQRSMFLVAMLGMIGTLAAGSYLINLGLITVGALLSSTYLISNLSEGVSNTAEYVMNLVSNKVLVDKVEAKMPKVKDEEILEGCEKADFPVSIDSLGYSFGEKRLFEGLNMEIGEGKSLAIIGHSGSGKSTLTKILLKYYDDYEGDIRYGDCPLESLTEEQIYDFIHVMPQSSFLIKGSLFDNISMRDKNIKEDSKEYQDILKQVNLLGVNERIGHMDTIEIDKLSGGEKQRVALARALLSGKETIIFDEPTTGLDPENQQLINDLIFKSKDTARVVITHNWDEDFLNRFDNVVEL